MNLKQKKYDLMNTRKGLLDEAKAILMKDGQTEDYTAKMAEVDKLNSQIEAVDALIAQEEKSFGGCDPAPEGSLKGGALGSGAEETGYQKAVKAFAAAARAGFPTQKAAGDMMQEGVNADGRLCRAGGHCDRNH